MSGIRRFCTALRIGWAGIRKYGLGDYLFVVCALGLFAYIFKVRNKLAVTGRTDLRVGPNDIVVLPHASLLDHFMAQVVLNWNTGLVFRDFDTIVGFLAERQNFYGNSLLRRAMRLGRVIPIDRDPSKRPADAEDPIEVALSRLQRGPIGVNPQGTRVKPGDKVRLKPGVGQIIDKALRAGYPIRIIPVWFDTDAMFSLQPHFKTFNDVVPLSTGWRIVRLLFGKRVRWILQHTAGNTIPVDIGEPVCADTLLATVAGLSSATRRAVVLTRAVMEMAEQLDPAQHQREA